MAAERSEAAAFCVGATSCASRSNKRESSIPVVSAGQRAVNRRKSGARRCYGLGTRRRPGGDDGNKLRGDDRGYRLNCGILFTPLTELGCKDANASVDSRQWDGDRTKRDRVRRNGAHLCTPPCGGGRVRCVTRNRSEARDDALVVPVGERREQFFSRADPDNDAARVEYSGRARQRVAQRIGIGR